MIIDLYINPFKATGQQYDIRMVDYNLLGLHKKEYFDTRGDLVLIDYYTDYDDVNDVYTGLAVKEERTYSRDSVSGLLTSRSSNITWYDVNGEVNATKQNLVKYYSAKKGFTANKRARQNIIDKASMYLYQELLTANLGDKDATNLQIDDFESLTNSAQAKYVNSNTQPLLDIITNSTDNTKTEYRDYITTAMQATLLVILNVNYSS